MPVILQPEDWATWLSVETPKKELLGLLESAPEGALDVHPVSVLVNNTKNDDPSCIQAI
jgi:putative SOS response-associated peptidase YedK